MKAKTVIENGFKETEIGLIPSDWDLTCLEKISKRLKAGGTPNTGVEKYWGGKIPLVKVEDVVNSDKYLTKTKLNITQEGLDASSAYLLPKESLLFTMYGTAGEAAINKIPAAPTQNVLGIEPSEEININFLYYALKYSKNIALELIVDRTIFKHFTLAKAKRLLIAKPEKDEQQKIAFVLSKIQQAIEHQDKIIQITKELKKSLMNKLFTEGLHGEEQKESEIGFIPKSWDVKKLGDVFEIQQGKQLSSKFQKGISPYPFLRTANVLWGRIDILTVDSMDFTPKEVAKLTLKKEDLLVCEGGDIGRTAMWDEQLSLCLYQNHLHRLRPLKKDILPKFYMYWMQVAHLYLRIYEGAGNRTTIPNLSQSRLRLFLLPIPSLDEQKEIANILSNIDKKIQQAESRKQTLQVLFKTMLNQLMTGRVRVKNLDIEVN